MSSAMDKKAQTSSMPFRLPNDDEDTSRPLLDPQDLEEQPSFSVTFSTIQILRLPVIPIAIADSVIMSHCEYELAAGIFLLLFPIGLCIWTFINLISSLGSGKDKVELKFGNYVCFCGKRSKGRNNEVPTQLARPYLSIIGDFFFCIMLMVITILSKKTNIWDWRWYNVVFGLSLTLCIFEFGISVLNFSTHFRRAKIVVYAAEYNEKVDYAIPDRQIYLDDGSEPRASSSSLV
ncbi:hypothetical protein BGZ63DRAFT_426544 [Mariannaea sp. PMI_226]|nr:hypothetical protein BGZ63DRAFT_426544 [Mariannaea sp. PMI_226]